MDPKNFLVPKIFCFGLIKIFFWVVQMLQVSFSIFSFLLSRANFACAASGGRRSPAQPWVTTSNWDRQTTFSPCTMSSWSLRTAWPDSSCRQQSRDVIHDITDDSVVLLAQKRGWPSRRGTVVVSWKVSQKAEVVLRTDSSSPYRIYYYGINQILPAVNTWPWHGIKF